MRRKYVFSEVSVEIEGSDRVNPEIQLFNSYDITWPFIVLLGAFRFVCANGLVVGKKFLHFRKRHVFDFDQIRLNEQVSTSLKRFERQTEKWKQWTNRLLTVAAYNQTMAAMKFGKKATREIDERVFQEAEGYEDYNDFPVINLWAFFNILTWYVTHKTVSLNHRVEMENRIRRAIKYFN